VGMKILVESCFRLETKLLKKDLRLAREHKTGLGGFINIRFGDKESVADYYFEYDSEYDYLVIQYGETEQKIKLTESELYFGTRSWFVCDCGSCASKLYLPPNSKEFKCRRCHNLVYELTTFNRNSKHGQVFYRTNRLIKLMNAEEEMRSKFYNGKPTMRFDRFLTLSDRVGFKSSRENAEKLLLAINSL